MSSLGGQFPEELKRIRIEETLKPGCVVKLEIVFPRITKPKLLVLVATDDPEYLSFLVNSEINPFISKKPELLRCQVIIDVENHDFLEYDSNVACHEIYTIRREDVIKKMMDDPSSIKGSISSDVCEQIKSAVKMAKTIDKDKKSCILASLDKAF